MMAPVSFEQAVRWTGGKGAHLSEENLSFTNISTDTRAVASGDLFVALRGDRFDGHEFLAEAKAAGALAAVVEQADDSVDMPQIEVADTVDALADLAAGLRNQSHVRCVAVTGSSGKTTVREMTAAILVEMGATLATQGNLNNHIGAPLTLFRLSPEHKFAAIELGASGLGEIAHTVRIAQPEVAILTNAGEAHLEGFGSYENIVQAKGEIIDGLSPDGVAVLNYDDPAFPLWRARAGSRKVLSVSRQAESEADYWPSEVVRAGGEQSYVAHGTDGWQCAVRLKLLGDHNIVNSLMAIAAARSLGASDEDIQRGLEKLAPVKGRLQALALNAQITVIDDSYNANPSSMKAAVDVLAQHPGTRIAVFGAMAELGDTAFELHREVGAHAREQEIDRLLVVGHGCEGYTEGFGRATEVCATHDDAIRRLIEGPAEQRTVLVKGSRSSAMDLVVKGLKEKVGDACCSG